MSTRPILLLGAANPVRTRIHEILVAAGYPVMMAESAADALRLAAARSPRAVVAPVDAGEEWRRLVHVVDEHFDRTVPVVVVGQDSIGVAGAAAAPRPVLCREPGFGRQLLEEIQYAERTFRPSTAADPRRATRVGLIPFPRRQVASR